MRKRILRFVLVCLRGFGRLIERLGRFLERSVERSPEEIESLVWMEGPEPEVKIGDIAVNPKWTWITVKNPKGRKNGNNFFDFGERAGIQQYGKLTAVAIDGDDVLVSYESPRGQGYGSEAGNGTLLFVPKRYFAAMNQASLQLIQQDEEEKQRILAMLRGLAEQEA